MNKFNRCVIESSVLAINSSNKPLYLFTQLLVLRNLTSRRYCYKYKTDTLFVATAIQEFIYGFKPSSNSFGIVKTFNTQNYLSIAKCISEDISLLFKSLGCSSRLVLTVN